MKALIFILLVLSLGIKAQDTLSISDTLFYKGSFFKDPKAIFTTTTLSYTIYSNYKFVNSFEYNDTPKSEQTIIVLKNYAIGAAVTIVGMLVINRVQKSQLFKRKRPKRYKKHKSTIKFY